MDRYLAHEEKYRGLTIKIYQDDNPESPRTWKNLGKMVCFHKRYDLGDKHGFNSDMFDGWEEMEDYLIKEEKAILIFPLYLYDHSGLRMKIGSFYGCGLPQGHARFDSGQVGFIYVTAEDIKKEYGVKRITKKTLQRVKKVLENEVTTYDDYLSGNVWGFVIEDKDGENIDSCWGFFGHYKKWALKDAKDIIDHSTNKGKTDYHGQYITDFIKN